MDEDGDASESVRLDGRHLLAEQWAVDLCEPLVPTAVRLDVESRMAAMFDSDARAWATAFASVFLHGLVVSLPPDDPWRTLRFYLPAGPQRSPMSLVEGAWRTDGQPFGTPLDATDLLILSHADHPESDFIAAGSRLTVPGWFSAPAGALVGAAGVSWRTAFHALCVQLALRPAPQVFDGIIQATACLLHRRRAYLGHNDETLPIHVFTSMAFADRVAASLPASYLATDVVAGRIASLAVFDEYRFMAEAVPDQLYDDMAIRTDDLDDLF